MMARAYAAERTQRVRVTGWRVSAEAADIQIKGIFHHKSLSESSSVLCMEPRLIYVAPKPSYLELVAWMQRSRTIQLIQTSVNARSRLPAGGHVGRSLKFEFVQLSGEALPRGLLAPPRVTPGDGMLICIVYHLLDLPDVYAKTSCHSKSTSSSHSTVSVCPLSQAAVRH